MTGQDATFPRVSVGVGLVASAAGWVATDIPDGDRVGWPLLVAGGALAAGRTVQYMRGRRDTNATLGRWSRTARRHGGTASWWDHWRVSSAWAMRRQAATLKPSLADLSWWQRYRTPVTEYATQLARAGRHPIWSPCEDVTLRVGGPRTGKTGELACRIVDAPGAVLATSTRTDVVELTAPVRARRGAVHVFNPGGLGGWASTIKWSPLVGCRVPQIAQRRAADMIPASPSAEGERWDVQARAVLAVLMHAAALGDHPMRVVLAWVSRPDAAAARDVDDALKSSREERAMRLAAAQFFGQNDRTKTSITTSVMPALRWLTDSRAAAIGDCHADELLDVRDLILSRSTVYLLGAEDGVAAPLIAALTAEFAWQARIEASMGRGGRLDPAFTIALDEAAIVCPVPLDRWTADMGGRGVTIHVSLQSRSQLRQRWGDAGAATILNNCASILVYGGARDPDDLAAWSTLSGEREVVVETKDDAGKVTSTTTRKEPILSSGRIANLPAGHCMVVRRGMPVCIGRTAMAWKRRDIRSAISASPYAPILETAYADDAEGQP